MQAARRNRLVGEASEDGEQVKECATSLKESFVSRAAWRIFVDTFSGKARRGFVNAAIELLSRNRIGELVVTVFFFEVVEPFFSSRLHPYTSLRESVCH